MSDAKTTIRKFIDSFLAGRTVGDDEDIFAAGHVNSLFVMQLVLMVEKDFSVVVEDEDLVIDNFRTVNAVADLVGRKLAVSSSPA
jgi:acyl carrier protein